MRIHPCTPSRSTAGTPPKTRPTIKKRNAQGDDGSDAERGREGTWVVAEVMVGMGVGVCVWGNGGGGGGGDGGGGGGGGGGGSDGVVVGAHGVCGVGGRGGGRGLVVALLLVDVAGVLVVVVIVLRLVALITRSAVTQTLLLLLPLWSDKPTKRMKRRHACTRHTRPKNIFPRLSKTGAGVT